MRTQTTTAGDQTPQSFILGTYMTAGNLIAPEMSHGENGDTRYLTRVVDFSDLPVDRLDYLIVDGVRHNMTGPSHQGYGPTSERERYAGYLFCRFYDGRQSAADPMLLDRYADHPERPWSADMVGRGMSYAALTLLWRKDPQIWSGRPDVKAVLRGIRLYDPRKDSTVGGSGTHRWGTQSSYEWRSNPALIIYKIRAAGRQDLWRWLDVRRSAAGGLGRSDE